MHNPQPDPVIARLVAEYFAAPPISEAEYEATWTKVEEALNAS
jgi:hypothetical protein